MSSVKNCCCFSIFFIVFILEMCQLLQMIDFSSWLKNTVDGQFKFRRQIKC